MTLNKNAMIRCYSVTQFVKPKFKCHACTPVTPKIQKSNDTAIRRYA